MKRPWVLSVALGLAATGCADEEGSLGAYGGGELDPSDDGELPEPRVGEVCGDPAEAIREAPSLLSVQFENSCGGCHGDFGQGLGGTPGTKPIPPLASTLGFEAFREIVRQGREGPLGKMPAFSEEAISDEQLQADWELLVAIAPADRAEAATLRPVAPPPHMKSDDPDEVRAVIERGLEAWRAPGKLGACAGCHGPEGIDLARLGYEDSDILRRAMGQEMTNAEAQSIVEMVHALRTKYGITEPCDERMPVFQPGGRVLPGDTVAERDLAVMDELRRHEIPIDGRVLDVDHAREFVRGFLAAGYLNIRVPFEFNRWTEDRFFGDERRSMAEWIPEYAREPLPGAQDEWFALHDTYIADPSDENLWAIYDAVPTLTEAATDLTDGSAPDSDSASLAQRRYQSVLIAQHMMRTGELKFPRRYTDEEREYLWGGLQLAQADDERQETLLSRDSIWDAGEIAMTFNRGAIEMQSMDFAPFILEKMSIESDEDAKFLRSDFGIAAIPWMWLGLASDPALQVTNGGRASTEYFRTRFTRTLDLNSSGSGWPKRENEYLVAHTLQNLMVTIGEVEGLDEGIPLNNFGGEGRRGAWASHSIWNRWAPPKDDHHGHGGDGEEKEPPTYEGIEAERERARAQLQLNFERAVFFLTVLDLQEHGEYGHHLIDPSAFTRLRDRLIAAGPEDEAVVWEELHALALRLHASSVCVGSKCDE